MTPKNTQNTTEETVVCDGNGEDSGHPRVFLTLNAKGEVTCPYCSRHFTRKS